MFNVKFATIVIWIFFLGSCASISETDSEMVTEKASAYVMIPRDQSAGVSKINFLDGERVDYVDLLSVSPGVHTLGVACKLDNGVGLSYSLEIDFEAEHYYCIKTVNPGKTCSVGYTKSLSLDAAKFTCHFLAK